MAQERIDPIRLQDTLDDIIGSVDWAVRYMESLMESGDPPAYDSDLPGLKADLHRLRVVADALVPGRVVDRDNGKRWFLAPDDATQRLASVAHHLDTADQTVERAYEEAQAERDQREATMRRGEEAKAAQQKRLKESREHVLRYLQEVETATAKQMGEALEISEWDAEHHAKELGATRGRDRKFRLPPKHQPTEPHTDACPDCGKARDGKWWMLAYAAVREAPGEYNGYVAFYRCERGHHWQTGWADELRLSPFDVEQSIRASREMFERPDESE